MARPVHDTLQDFVDLAAILMALRAVRPGLTERELADWLRVKLDQPN